MKFLASFILVFPQITLAAFGDSPKYIVFCPAKESKISFDIWADGSKYEIRNFTLQNQNGVNKAVVDILSVNSANDKDAFISFSELNGRIEGGEVMTLSATQSDRYKLTIQGSDMEKQYQCIVGIPKPGVIISN